MKRNYMIGYALAAAFCAGQAHAEELTGTLKNIKETGASRSASAIPRFRSPISTTTRSRSAMRWTSATRSSTP
jgi:hypothetical protein